MSMVRYERAKDQARFSVPLWMPASFSSSGSGRPCMRMSCATVPSTGAISYCRGRARGVRGRVRIVAELTGCGADHDDVDGGDDDFDIDINEHDNHDNGTAADVDDDPGSD